MLAGLSVLFLCLWQKERRENEPKAPAFAVEKILLTAQEKGAADEAAILSYLETLTDEGDWEIKICFHGMLDEQAVKAFLRDLSYEDLALVYDEAMMTIYTLRIPAGKDVTDTLITLSGESVVKSLSFAPAGAFLEN